MSLSVAESFDAHSVDGLPDESTINDAVDQVAEKLLALREAPVVDPTTAPAILEGRAAAVFFHEVLGHRVEGHRQKDEDEGQTLLTTLPCLLYPPSFPSTTEVSSFFKKTRSSEVQVMLM